MAKSKQPKPHTSKKFEKILQIISQAETDKDNVKAAMWKKILKAAQDKEKQ